MKSDIFTASVAAIIGALIAFFVTNLFLGPIESVTYKTVNDSAGSDLVEPDPEIFNYNALDPTVEVYVGNCEEYNQNGECIENKQSDQENDITNDEENSEQENEENESPTEEQENQENQ